jgi:hypothetical protein
MSQKVQNQQGPSPSAASQPPAGKAEGDGVQGEGNYEAARRRPLRSRRASWRSRPRKASSAPKGTIPRMSPPCIRGARTPIASRLGR